MSNCTVDWLLMRRTWVTTGTNSVSELTWRTEMGRMLGSFSAAAAAICTQQLSNHPASAPGQADFQICSNSVNLVDWSRETRPKISNARGTQKEIVAEALINLVCSSGLMG